MLFEIVDPILGKDNEFKSHHETNKNFPHNLLTRLPTVRSDPQNMHFRDPQELLSYKILRKWALQIINLQYYELPPLRDWIRRRQHHPSIKLPAKSNRTWHSTT